jgi:hypothetical protein
MWKRWRGPSVLCLALGLLAACGGSDEPGRAANGGRLVTAQELAARLSAIERRVPLPPHEAYRIALDPQVGRYPAEAAEQMVYDQAQCKWYAYWLDASEAKRAAAARQALFVLRSFHESGPYRHADESFRLLVAEIEAKAAKGDPSGIQAYVRLNC